jgi:hypothetical protein
MSDDFRQLASADIPDDARQEIYAMERRRNLHDTARPFDTTSFIVGCATGLVAAVVIVAAATMLAIHYA